MAEKTPTVGLVLAGRYKLELKLGEGGMGTVWRAEHLVLCAPVAVKILERDVTRDEEAHDRFIREARSAATLRSPHVVQILDYGIDGGFPYIVMELLEGETLAQRITRVGRLNAIETARVVTHVARAVGRAHDAGIIHRDLKPENVFLVQNEDAQIAKVLDFGVAKVEKAELGPKGTRTRTGSLLGTPFYMSPEQAQGNKTIDHRSDLWSLGVIAFECVTGKRPFESDGLGDLVLQICVRDIPVPSSVAAVPPKFDEWFAKATERDPEARFQTARELSDALRDVVGVEARDTLATIPEEDLAVGPKSVVIHSARGDAASATAKTIVSAPVDGEASEGDAPVASTRKPAHTIQQSETTHATSAAPANRMALVVGVGALALTAGLVGGFFALGGTSGLGGSETATDGEDAGVASDPSRVSAKREPRVEPEPGSQSEAPLGSGEADASAAVRADDGGAATDASVQGSGKADDKKDKDRKKDAGVDASVFKYQDWGKTEDPPPSEPDKPQPKTDPQNKLPSPPAPIPADH